jgi:Flp pilus assembly protein TadG
MIAYGIYFGASHSVQQLAADAARIAMSGLSASERRALVTDFINRNGSGYAFVDAHDSAADGSQFVVAVAYDASNLPIWGLFEGIAMPGKTIRRQSTIRIGGL